MMDIRANTRIEGNKISANGDLGLDFLDDGVSGNGQHAPDALPPFPLLTRAAASSAGTSVQGTIDHPAGHLVRIEVLASPACDDSGHGQGHTPLGTLTLTAPGRKAAFSAVVAATPGGSNVITATATDLTSNRTSEYSPCARRSSQPPPVAETPPPPRRRSGRGDAASASARHAARAAPDRPPAHRRAAPDPLQGPEGRRPDPRQGEEADQGGRVPGRQGHTARRAPAQGLQARRQACQPAAGRDPREGHGGRPHAGLRPPPLTCRAEVGCASPPRAPAVEPRRSARAAALRGRPRPL
jgi:hypothetical protein